MLHVAGLCEGNSPVAGELPAQRASNAENVSIWCHYVFIFDKQLPIYISTEHPEVATCSTSGEHKNRVGFKNIYTDVDRMSRLIDHRLPWILTYCGVSYMV